MDDDLTYPCLTCNRYTCRCGGDVPAPAPDWTTTMSGSAAIASVWSADTSARRVWGSNPRDGMNRLAAFKAAALDRYANPPAGSS